jgi:hypothetical protein
MDRDSKGDPAEPSEGSRRFKGMRITSIRRRITLVAVGVVLALMVPSPANAGGNWIELSRRQLLVGARVTARAVFFTKSKAPVVEQGPYFAYIAPERMGWRLPDPSHPRTVRLGRVRVLWPEDHDWKGMFRNNPRARLEFEVPDMPGGKYVMSFCNRACSSALGDVDPTGYLWVVHTPAEGGSSTDCMKFANNSEKRGIGRDRLPRGGRRRFRESEPWRSSSMPRWVGSPQHRSVRKIWRGTLLQLSSDRHENASPSVPFLRSSH